MCNSLYKIAKANRAETMPRRCAHFLGPIASDDFPETMHIFSESMHTGAALSKSETQKRKRTAPEKLQVTKAKSEAMFREQVSYRKRMGTL